MTDTEFLSRLTHPRKNSRPLINHDTDTLIISVSIKGDHIEFRTSPKKSGLDLWGRCCCSCARCD